MCNTSRRVRINKLPESKIKQKRGDVEKYLRLQRKVMTLQVARINLILERGKESDQYKNCKLKHIHKG